MPAIADKNGIDIKLNGFVKVALADISTVLRNGTPGNEKELRDMLEKGILILAEQCYDKGITDGEEKVRDEVRKYLTKYY